MKLLVDTSVWSLALRRDCPPDAPEVRRLSAALEGGDDLFTTGLVMQELLQGFAAPGAEASIVDLGYVYDLSIRNGAAHVLVTMPHRGRPVYEFLETAGGGRVAGGIREHVLKVKGIEDVIVDFTWEPAWSVARVNDVGRKALGLVS